LPAPPQLLCEQPRKSSFPLLNCLVSKLEPTQQKQLGQIAQAQFIAEAAEQYLKDDVGRKLEMVERCAGALIELAPTETAAKNGIAQIRGVILLRSLRRLAMRTIHEQDKNSEYQSVDPHLLANRQS
jgi:hypothetical protein